MSSRCLTGEMEVNPTLLHVLSTDFGCNVDQAALATRISDGSIDEQSELLETCGMPTQARTTRSTRYTRLG
jgi:hypothetical protein